MRSQINFGCPNMSLAETLARYVEAFNRGDAEIYGSFYAPDVTLRNGAGEVLHGRSTIIEYYAGVRDKLHRVMELRGVAEGEDCCAAALASTFTALQDSVPLGGEILNTGDRLAIESMALYELESGRFARINATTLRRRIIRKGEDR